MSADPIMQAPYWSQGLNRYSYVFNDPINSTDPSGMAVEGDTQAGIGIMGWGAATVGLAAATAYGLGGSAGAVSGLGGGLGNVAQTLLTPGFGAARAGGSFHVTPSAQAPNTTMPPRSPYAPQNQGAPGAAVQEGASKLDTPLPRGPDARPKLAVEIPGTGVDFDPNFDPTNPSVTLGGASGRTWSRRARPTFAWATLRTHLLERCRLPSISLPRMRDTTWRQRCAKHFSKD